MLTTVILILFAVAVAIQCGYAMLYAGMFVALQRAFRRRKVTPADAVEYFPVSVVICARNESRNLAENLPIVLSQRYTNRQGWKAYEVIVVNDGSTDDTADTLHALSAYHEHLRIIHLNDDAERTLPGKKFPLMHGVAAARYAHLLFTDADCEPASEFWLETMTAPLREGREIAAGYGGYRFRRGPLNAFVRWETMHTWLQYSSYTRAGKPYMAVGRNLACTKSAFEKAQQSSAWKALPSGDDDLLVSSQGTASNAAIVDRPDAFTHTAAKRTWQEWLGQKKRHLSTGKFYPGNIKALLGLYALSHALVWVGFIALLFTREWEVPILLMILRCSLYWALWYRSARQIGQKKLVRWFPLCDAGWLIYNFVLLPYIAWKNKQQWTSS